MGELERKNMRENEQDIKKRNTNTAYKLVKDIIENGNKLK
jgi:hypothetical protein